MFRLFIVFFLLAQTSVTVALTTSPLATNKSFEKQSYLEGTTLNRRGYSSRRAFFENVSLVLPMVVGINPAIALDMDAFINKELATDNTKSEMSDDEALCKFGSPSGRTGDVRIN